MYIALNLVLSPWQSYSPRTGGQGFMQLLSLVFVSIRTETNALSVTILIKSAQQFFRLVLFMTT